ncbi:unnamed protein product [Protopolystoma xenopodis]|uniref:Uncharacterized protein n=1 Tax=Protopolystoma xenopodis TaxID=117903 RepID=A0A448WPJ0_9PLAT|nr:unnamed protein product [Protopolystoma xenopodis]
MDEVYRTTVGYESIPATSLAVSSGLDKTGIITSLSGATTLNTSVSVGDSSSSCCDNSFPTSSPCASASVTISSSSPCSTSPTTLLPHLQPLQPASFSSDLSSIPHGSNHNLSSLGAGVTETCITLDLALDTAASNRATALRPLPAAGRFSFATGSLIGIPTVNTISSRSLATSHVSVPNSASSLVAGPSPSYIGAITSLGTYGLELPF